MPDLNSLVDRLSDLTVLEAAELAKMLEEKWGVSAATPVVQTGPAPATPAEPEAPPQSEFTVKLTSYGDKKVNVVRVIRSITGLDLHSSMDVANKTTEGPQLLKADVSRTAADDIKKQIEEAGGQVSIE